MMGATQRACQGLARAEYPVKMKRINAEAVTMPRGRPSAFTPEIAESIIQGLSEGTPLTVICAGDGMPGIRTVYDWMDRDAAFSADIARARESGFDAIADRLRETARERGDSTGDVARDKLIVDTDLKLLAKWDPKRYGDRIATEISGPGGGPIPSAAVMSPEMERDISDCMEMVRNNLRIPEGLKALGS